MGKVARSNMARSGRAHERKRRTQSGQQRSVPEHELLGSGRDPVETIAEPSSQQPLKLSAFSSLLLVSESITRAAYLSTHEKDARALYNSMRGWVKTLADPNDSEAITCGLDLVRIEGSPPTAGIDRNNMTQLGPDDLGTVENARKALEKYWIQDGADQRAGVAKLYRCFCDVETELRGAPNTSIPETYKPMELPIRPGNSYVTYGSPSSGQFS